MRILGIDTATPTASAALIEDGEVLAEQIHSSRQSARHPQITIPKAHHAEVILPLIGAVLSAASASWQNLSGLAVSIGPGSFTGLRIGVSTVKGLGYGMEIPVVGVSTLLANAARVNDFDGLICSLLDARKGEVYAALFRRNGTALTRLTEDKAVGIADVTAELIRKSNGTEPCLFIGDGSTAYATSLIDALGDRAILRTDSSPSMASAVARLATNRLEAGGEYNLGSLAPVYLPSFETRIEEQKSHLNA